MDATRLAVDFVAAWNEDHPERRWELVTRSLAEGVEIFGPGAELRGHGEVLAAIAAFRGEQPVRRTVLTSPVQAHHRFGRYSFAIEDETGAVLARGTDLLELGPDGRLARVVTFLEGDAPDA